MIFLVLVFSILRRCRFCFFSMMWSAKGVQEEGEMSEIVQAKRKTKRIWNHCCCVWEWPAIDRVSVYNAVAINAHPKFLNFFRQAFLVKWSSNFFIFIMVITRCFIINSFPSLHTTFTFLFIFFIWTYRLLKDLTLSVHSFS